MAARNLSLTGAPAAKDKNWGSISWSKVESGVKRLQMRIAKAEREGKMGKVEALQRLLTC